MAKLVDSVIRRGGIALIEAGTGIGKTLAYLIPAIASGRRVLISTATKNLQEQLYKKDIPFLQGAIPRKLRVACMKGRSNYICLHRLKLAERVPMLAELQQVDHFDQIRRWAAKTETGDRAELTDLPEDLPFWPQIDARAEICLGQKCPDYDPCFITEMRRRALEADLIVVNHHLFFADLALRGQDHGAVLPDYSTVIFDEAHEIEDVASQYFGASVSSYRINELITDAQKLILTEADRAKELLAALSRLAQRADSFWALLEKGLRGESELEGHLNVEGRLLLDRRLFQSRKSSLTALGESYVALSNALDRLLGALGVISEQSLELESIMRRAESLRLDLEFIIEDGDRKFVRWYERRGRGAFLHATPIDVSSILADRLFSNLHSAVLTSATLAAGDSFDFIRSRLGINGARELIIESPFDYSRQAILYLPERMPDPRSPEFLEASAEQIVRILEVSRGRAFVLFTSVAAMRDTYELVRDRIPFPTMIQGQGSKSGLLERFRNTDGSVLFATSSFWQGVDVQGEALSCVIIPKLPFAVPTDPVVAARQRYIDEQGGNSFYEYSVPQAIITLKQGLGRLIRSTTDRGILSILDPRLKTKPYGRLFLDSLPPCRITANLEEAATIFH
jgi:ATP-dependent DNA helicase DinG